MQGSGAGASSGVTQIAIYVILVAWVIFRSSRPQRISVTRLWVSPIILMAIATVAIFSTETLFHPPIWQVAIAVLLGLAAGIPVGILRGFHTLVEATAQHGVMRLGPSWATAAIYLAAFGLRYLIRFMVPMTSPIGSVVGDALLVFAIAIVAATYFAIYQKYEKLDKAVPSA